MRSLLLLLWMLSTYQFTTAQTSDLSYYFAEHPLKTSGGAFDQSITTPEEYLGYNVGEWHISHDQLVGYMRTLAAESNRMTIETYAHTYERRPLLLLTVTSPDNHKNIDQIQANHYKLYDGGDGKFDRSDIPVVIYQGYSVHGNEASGANAAVLYAYYLAAAQGAEMDNILNNSVVLLDPCFNPDGLHRFAGWVNTHKSYNLVADGESRELNEVWPGGRTNHYWFDLNRDWLLLAHPESRGRIRNFQKWKPNILTDHHEMGSNSTFFFQPGIPTRTNPLTPKRNQELTYKIGEYHAEALDAIGSLYYAQESFDDFYYGKGSTYPDVQGCIGILFEQASARGHLHESQHGDLSFPFAVRNQLMTSLSTLKAGYNLRSELLEFQQSFFSNSRSEATRDKNKAYTFSAPQDQNKLRAFLKILVQHDIKVYKGKEDNYVVPTKQSQYRLIKGIFDKQKEFTDSLFYDVSAWTLPLAFNIDHQTSGSLGNLGAPLTMDDLKARPYQLQKSDYAYLLEWKDYLSPKALYHIQKKGLRTKVANETFTVKTPEGMRSFEIGTILIPAKNQSLNTDQVFQVIQEASQSADLPIYAASTGFTTKGIDLGSPSFSNVPKPKLLVVVGEGVSSYDAGEVWHLMDQRYQIPTTLVDVLDFNSADLDNFTTVALVNGSYSRLGKSGSEKLKDWVQAGGTLVAMRGAINWAKGAGLANVNFVTTEAKKDDKDDERRPYNKRSADSGADVIGGAIYEVKIDVTNPLFYGYQNERLPIFRRGTSFMKLPKNKYASPAIYTDMPLLAGYSSDKNVKKAAGAAAIINCRAGRGRVICISDNPNFRAFWYGTNKIFANALFFGGTLSRGALENAAPKKN